MFPKTMNAFKATFSAPIQRTKSLFIRLDPRQTILFTVAVVELVGLCFD